MLVQAQRKGREIITIKGRYNEAKVFTDDVESSAKEQIMTLVDQAFTEGSKIRVMPDVHAGAGSTIGTTMTIQDKVVPNLVGVDIGCGIETTELKVRDLDLKKLDREIKELIPSGRHVRHRAHERGRDFPIEELRARSSLNVNERRERRALGTLGGGNHFIEIDRADDGRLFLLIHSGSRHLGLRVALHYQDLAWKGIKAKKKELHHKKNKTSADHEKLAELNALPKDLAYLEGKLFEDYLHDMALMQRYAVENRKLMTDIILEAMNLEVQDSFTTIHNYIDMDSMILRKGAVSALEGEKLLIPLNMRDGSLICVGKGNPDWNYSAPHGAGRAFSRTAARKTFDLQEFRRSMEGIYSTSISPATLDEAPMAYKPLEAITEFSQDTIEIVDHIRPIYNFKAKN